MDVALRSATVLRKENAQATDRLASNDDAGAIAVQGVSGPPGSVPHVAKMQSAFEGTLDLSTVNVHQGPEAADAAARLGAHAYAFGSSIALPQAADEFTTAHELAHVAQGQQGKVQRKGVSIPDDAEERQADAVAARVVAGEPIGDLLCASTCHRGNASPSTGAVMRRGVTEDDMHGPASKAVGEVFQPAAVANAANAIEKARGMMEAILDDARNKRRPLNVLLAQALGWLAGVHHPIGALATHAPEEGSLPFDIAIQHLDGLFAAAWQLHDLADGVQPYPAEAELLRQEMSRVASSGQRIRWTAPTSITEVRQRQRKETACEPGSEDDHSRRPACMLKEDIRDDLRDKAGIGLMLAGKIFFDECNAKADALRAAIARDQALWGTIAGAAANAILAVLSGGVALASAPAGTAAGAGAAAGVGGVADAAASVPVVSSEFGAAMREMGTKIANDLGKEVLRNRTREAARSSLDGRSGDERQQTIDGLAMLSTAFMARLARVSATLGSLTDEQLIELKNALLDTATIQKNSAQFVAKFVADFRSELEPIGMRDHASGLGAPPERMLPGVVHHRAIFVEGMGGKPRLALVRHVTDAFPAIRQAGRAAGDAFARGIDAVSEGDTYDEQAWKDYRAEPGDEFHFERWIKNEDFQKIAGRGAPTIPASRVQGLSFADMLGVEEK